MPGLAAPLDEPAPVNWRKMAIVVGVLGVVVWGLVANDKGTATPIATAPASSVPSTPLVDSLLKPSPPSANRPLTLDEVKEAQT